MRKRKFVRTSKDVQIMESSRMTRTKDECKNTKKTGCATSLFIEAVDFKNFAEDQIIISFEADQGPGVTYD